MPFPADRGRKAEITLDTSAASGFVPGVSASVLVPITADHLPSDMLDADGAVPSQADGFDVAFSLDEFGANRLPVHLRRYVQNNDPALAEALFVLCLDLDQDVAASVWVWWYSATETFVEAAVTDPFGRNAVYGSSGAGFSAFWGFDESHADAAPQYLDWTGNDYHALVENNAQTTLGTGVLGTPGIETNFALTGRHDSRIEVVGLSVTLPQTGWTITAWTYAGVEAFNNRWLGAIGATTVEGNHDGGANAANLGLANPINGNFSVNADHTGEASGNIKPNVFSLDGVADTYSAWAPGGQSQQVGAIQDADYQLENLTFGQNSNGSYTGITRAISDVGVIPAARSRAWAETYGRIWGGWDGYDTADFASAGAVQLTAVTRTVTFVGCPPGTELRLYLLDALGGTIDPSGEIDGVEASVGANPVLTYQVTTTIPVRVVMHNVNYRHQSLDLTFTTDDQTIPAEYLLTPDRVYENPA